MKKSIKRINLPRFKGVFYRYSTIRNYKGKPDRCFDICYRDSQGKLVWEKVGWLSEGYNAATASQIRSERIRTIRHGDVLIKRKPKEVTLREVWERYNEWLETAKRRPKDDRGYYRKHIEPLFADRPLSKIQSYDLEKLMMKLTNDGLAPATVKHVLVIVRQLFNKAIAWDMWSGGNPIKKVKLPKLSNRRERFLTPEEVHMLLAELGNTSPQLHNISLLSLHTGMRAGEIFSLKWGHVDIENGLIHVADPKSSRPRKCFMTPTIKDLFLNLNPGEPSDFVFHSRVGGPIKEVSHAFDRVVKRLGFNNGITDARQKVTFHTLRHTFASWLALRGREILTIKELLGHQSLAMTERYSHLTPDHKKQAVEDIEKLFNSVQVSSLSSGKV
jgi:integrase